jgi:hypothetical protein
MRRASSSSTQFKIQKCPVGTCRSEEEVHSKFEMQSGRASECSARSPTDQRRRVHPSLLSPSTLALAYKYTGTCHRRGDSRFISTPSLLGCAYALHHNTSPLGCAQHTRKHQRVTAPLHTYRARRRPSHRWLVNRVSGEPNIYSEHFVFPASSSASSPAGEPHVVDSRTAGVRHKRRHGCPLYGPGTHASLAISARATTASCTGVRFGTARSAAISARPPSTASQQQDRGNKHATCVVQAAARRRDASMTTTAALQKWHPGKLHPYMCMMIHGRAQYGALRLDKAPVNSESSDGRNGKHSHRGGGAAVRRWPTSIKPRNTYTCACTIYIQYVRRESKQATVACKAVCGQITYAQVTTDSILLLGPLTAQC